MREVSKKRKHHAKDEKDGVIDKLKAINHRLKRRLKTLNVIVEKAIDKTDTKRILATFKQKKVDPGHAKLVKEKELENSEQ